MASALTAAKLASSSSMDAAQTKSTISQSDDVLATKTIASISSTNASCCRDKKQGHSRCPALHEDVNDKNNDDDKIGETADTFCAENASLLPTRSLSSAAAATVKTELQAELATHDKNDEGALEMDSHPMEEQSLLQHKFKVLFVYFIMMFPNDFFFIVEMVLLEMQSIFTMFSLHFRKLR
jgi:hypothetical protein